MKMILAAGALFLLTGCEVMPTVNEIFFPQPSGLDGLRWDSGGGDPCDDPRKPTPQYVIDAGCLE